MAAMAAGEGEMKDQLENDDYLNDLIKRYWTQSRILKLFLQTGYIRSSSEESIEENSTWKSSGLPGGTRWMIDVIFGVNPQ